jgi:hypothetical protein
MIFTELVTEKQTPIQPRGSGFFQFLERYLAVLWKDWPKEMKLSSLELNGPNAHLCLSGECPHCRAKAAFISVTTPLVEDIGDYDHRVIAAAKCLACNDFILAILKTVPVNSNARQFVYDRHYPLGKPDDSVSDDVPSEIREDSKEALRCHWIGAFKATVLMCRRSLQVSCDREGAQGKDLFSQIDDLAANQRITDPLKKMAHRIRLLGKRGAHGDFSDIDDTISEQDAADAIKFMRHYLEHVYELPARLDGGQP